MEGFMDQHLKALCVAVLTGSIGGEHFNRLLVETGICLNSYEWEVANKILEKADGMRCSLGRNLHSIH